MNFGQCWYSAQGETNPQVSPKLRHSHKTTNIQSQMPLELNPVSKFLNDYVDLSTRRTTFCWPLSLGTRNVFTDTVLSSATSRRVIRWEWTDVSEGHIIASYWFLASTLKIEAARSSETSADFQRTIRRYNNLEGRPLQDHRCENLKSYTKFQLIFCKRNDALQQPRPHNAKGNEQNVLWITAMAYLRHYPGTGLNRLSKKNLDHDSRAPGRHWNWELQVGTRIVSHSMVDVP
jgi:hypothetical protein